MYKHQLVATLLLSFLSLTALATDRYVDPSIWPATLPNYYMTVTQALNAAQSGDRIFIAPGAYATPDITISQNIEIYSMDTTDVVQLYNGSLNNLPGISISNIPGLQVKIKGISIGNLAINSGSNIQFSAEKLNMKALTVYGAQGMQCQFVRSAITSTINIFGADQMKINFDDVTNSGNQINLYGYAGMTCNFTKMISSTINGYSVTNGSATNRAYVNIIDCNFNDQVNFNSDYYEFNCIGTNVGNGQSPNHKIIFRYGSVITTRAYAVFVEDEPGGGNVADSVRKILIAADTLCFLNYRNDNYRFCVANNLLNNLFIHMWNWYSGNTNQVVNNDFVSNTFCTYGTYQINNLTKLMIAVNNVPYYNLDCSNNILPDYTRFFDGYSYWNCGGAGPIGHFGSNAVNPANYNTSDWDFYSSCNSYATMNANNSNCPFPNRNTPGFFKWTYNGFAIPGSGITPGNLTFINTPGTSNTVNAGNPAPEYTDIDLTRNDRGRLGGPYSILNYNPANPNNSKAFIFDLDIPTQFSPASPSINIQAKGYHRN